MNPNRRRRSAAMASATLITALAATVALQVASVAPAFADDLTTTVRFDSTGDGVEDTTAYDMDRNGTYEMMFYDSDGDGDVELWMYDDNQNGQFERLVADTNNDGGMDVFMTDSNADEVPDAVLVDANTNGMDDREEAQADMLVGPPTNLDPFLRLMYTLTEYTGQPVYGTPDSDSDGYDDNHDARPSDPRYR